MTDFPTRAALIQQDGGAPLVLDFCCKAGGMSHGMWQAGFRVIGIDIEAQAAYPFEFVEADVVKYGAELIERYRPDVVIGSPPCKLKTALVPAAKVHARKWDHVDIIPDVRRIFRGSGLPYVIENVEGARSSLIEPLTLCGTEFDLSALTDEHNGRERRWLKRHRLFESNVPLYGAGGCDDCSGRPGHRLIGGVYGGGGGHPRTAVSRGGRRRGGFQFHADGAREALGVPWMNRDECAQAIPPAYGLHIGLQLMSHLLAHGRTARPARVGSTVPGPQ